MMGQVHLRAVRRGAVLFALAALALAPTAASAQPRFDLRALDVGGPARAVEGRAISVDATFDVVGDTAPGPFHYALYLTTNGTTTSGALLLGRFGPTSLAASASRTVTNSVALPADVVGRFTLAVVVDVDDEVTELDELDNAAFAAQPLVIRAEAPNLVVASAHAQEAEGRAGDALHVEVSVRNDGELPATAIVGAYLSRGATVSTTDLAVGTTELTVPPGQTVSGVITGTVPLAAGVGDHTLGAIADPAGAVDEISELDNLARASRAFVVYTDALAVETTNVTDGTLAIDYDVVLGASGGDGHYAWRVSAGQLPAGLALATAGRLTGRPVASGSSTFTLEVSSHGRTASREYTVRVYPSGLSLQIVPTDVAPGALGHLYEQQLVASGGEPPYVWTLTAEQGDLPPGLDLTTDGVINGIPNTLGEFHFGVTVTDRAGDFAQLELAIAVAPPVNVLVLQRDLPHATIGAEFDYRLEATGGVGPYRWLALSSPPPGLTVTEQGHLRGTPEQVGRFQVRVQAKDSTRVGNTDTLLVELVVDDDGALRIETAEIPSVRVRTRYETQLVPMGGTPPLTWSLVPGDHLPAGFFLIQGDGTKVPSDVALVRGYTVHPGSTAFAVRVEDAYGRRAERVLLLEVERPPVTASSGGCTCTTGVAPASSLGVLALLGLGLALTRRRR